MRPPHNFSLQRRTLPIGNQAVLTARQVQLVRPLHAPHQLRHQQDLRDPYLQSEREVRQHLDTREVFQRLLRHCNKKGTTGRACETK